MEFNEKDIDKFSLLARLHLTDEEKKKFAINLSQVLTHVDAVMSADVSKVKPLKHVHEGLSVFREDKIGEHLPQSESLKNAPDKSGTFFRTPLIIEG